MKKKIAYILLTALLIVTCYCTRTADHELAAYLFVYFVGNGPGQEAIHYAISKDGYSYRALNNHKPILDPEKNSSTGGMRDPHIIRSEDGGTFYMVATDLYVPDMGWNNVAMVLMKSSDLVHWEPHVVNIPESFPEQYGDVDRVWAPQTIYDKEKGKYMVYFSMKQGNSPDKIYFAYANNTFTELESAPQQLYFPPETSNNKACIDGDIVFNDGRYYLFHKADDDDPGIKLAVSDKLTTGYELISNDRVDSETAPVEGSGVFKLNNSNEWILMYDVYTSSKYQFTKTTDLKSFEIVDEDISMNFHPRHGTVLPITSDELKNLIKHYATYDDLLVDFNAPELKELNIVSDAQHGSLYLPVHQFVNTKAFNPQISPFIEGINISPSGPQDFSQGPVAYTFSMEGHEDKVLKAKISIDNNPVLEGYYADPEILYAEKTGKYYIYPTSDGFMGWNGTYFKTFSSDDLVNWKDEGIILDLVKDVTWTSRNAWAPCIIEKKIKDEFRYFYYFTAAQKIGVAVASHPTGPFTDSGKPLIDFKPEGINRGQEIDPDVFTDPQTGISYLYWGNGYLAVAELNEDMTSIKKQTLKVMTPDGTFREGVYVFYRKGTYYFMWAEDDTRSPNYKVRYAMASGPTGKLHIPNNNIVIMQDEEKGIYATGHNSVIQVPGKDEWYIVYHRFTRPKGIAMGRAAGFHREVCIDHLQFDNEGKIIQVKPTLKGIEAI